MSDDISTDTTETPEAPELGDAGKKAIAAERRRADSLDKELKALRAESESRANAELSELERLKKENAELLSGKTAAELSSIRSQVALENGLPANLAARLQGTDYDTFTADAVSLAELVTGNKPTAPKADPSQGPKATGGAQTPAQQFAEAFDF